MSRWEVQTGLTVARACFSWEADAYDKVLTAQLKCAEWLKTLFLSMSSSKDRDM